MTQHRQSECCCEIESQATRTFKSLMAAGQSDVGERKRAIDAGDL